MGLRPGECPQRRASGFGCAGFCEQGIRADERRRSGLPRAQPVPAKTGHCVPVAPTSLPGSPWSITPRMGECEELRGRAVRVTRRLRGIARASLCLVVLAWQAAFATADGPDHYAVDGVAPGASLTVRAGPSAESDPIGEIPHDGRRLRNLGCQGGPTFAEWERMSESEREAARKQRWCKVAYRGLEGWVPGWLLREDSGDP